MTRSWPRPGKPHVYYRAGFWRMARPSGDMHAAPTIGALSAYVNHPWAKGWHA